MGLEPSIDDKPFLCRRTISSLSDDHCEGVISESQRILLRLAMHGVGSACYEGCFACNALLREFCSIRPGPYKCTTETRGQKLEIVSSQTYLSLEPRRAPWLKKCMKFRISSHMQITLARISARCCSAPHSALSLHPHAAHDRGQVGGTTIPIHWHLGKDDKKRQMVGGRDETNGVRMCQSAKDSADSPTATAGKKDFSVANRAGWTGKRKNKNLEQSPTE